jgi:arylsulfatase A-like enzyme
MKLKRTEGSMRTCAIVGRPGRIMAGATSYAMFSIMDFMPTLAAIVGGAMPTGRPIDWPRSFDQRQAPKGSMGQVKLSGRLATSMQRAVTNRWRRSHSFRISAGVGRW